MYSHDMQTTPEDISIMVLCEESAAIATKSGFVGQTLPEFIALVHSELSEALEEHRAGRRPMETHYTKSSPQLEAFVRQLYHLTPEAPLPKGVSISVPCDPEEVGAKPEGIPSELADVVIRICHYCGVNGINLAAAIREKTAYNCTRPYKHGGKII
jgi:hypothetical protein